MGPIREGTGTGVSGDPLAGVPGCIHIGDIVRDHFQSRLGHLEPRRAMEKVEVRPISDLPAQAETGRYPAGGACWPLGRYPAPELESSDPVRMEMVPDIISSPLRTK